MATVEVQQGQSLMDICMQHCGSATALKDLAILNNISPTSNVVVGSMLELPAVVNEGIVKYFKEKGVVPATSESAAKQLQQMQQEGIGYWSVGSDFVVQ